MRAFRLLSCAIALIATLAPAAQGQDTAETRRLTLLTFNQPVQLPGKTLPAGTYRFEMADINNAAHTVRVLSQDGRTVLGTFSTMSSTLPQRDLKDQGTLIMFAERPAGQAQAAREWFYPGRSMGEEFIYSKPQAQTLANANKTSVAASENGKIVRVEPESAPGANAPASASRAAAPAREQARQGNDTARPAAPASREPATVGTSGQTNPSQPRQSAQPARTLPRTASDLWLYSLLSGLAFAGAIGIHRYRLVTGTHR